MIFIIKKLILSQLWTMTYTLIQPVQAPSNVLSSKRKMNQYFGLTVQSRYSLNEKLTGKVLQITSPAMAVTICTLDVPGPTSH